MAWHDGSVDRPLANPAPAFGGEAVMQTYPRLLFLVWMLAVLIGIALSAPQVRGMPHAAHSAAGTQG